MALPSTNHLLSFTETTQQQILSTFMLKQIAHYIHIRKYSHSTFFHLHYITQTITNFEHRRVDGHFNHCFPSQIRMNMITLDFHTGLNGQYDPCSTRFHTQHTYNLNALPSQAPHIGRGEYNGIHQA